jgi:hypothetical protein
VYLAADAVRILYSLGLEKYMSKIGHGESRIALKRVPGHTDLLQFFMKCSFITPHSLARRFIPWI